MTDTDPPAPLRDLLADVITEAIETAPFETRATEAADAILSDPRIAVVRLPDAPTGSVNGSTFVEPVAYWDDDSTHRVVARGPVINCLRAYWNTDAGDDPTRFAAALLAAARHINNNRGDQS